MEMKTLGKGSQDHLVYSNCLRVWVADFYAMGIYRRNGFAFLSDISLKSIQKLRDKEQLRLQDGAFKMLEDGLPSSWERKFPRCA